LLTTGAVASSARVVSKTPTPIVRVVFVNILVPLKKTFNINKIDITLRTLLPHTGLYKRELEIYFTSTYFTSMIAA